MNYTLAFLDINGDAGQVREEWTWTLSQDFRPLREFDGPSNGKYYSLRKKNAVEWEIVAHPGLVWDYATGWFDYDAIKEASLGHDILHWLIAIGVIAEEHNDKIDQEFYLILRSCSVPHWRARLLRRGTNTVDQDTTGIDRKVLYLNHGRRIPHGNPRTPEEASSNEGSSRH